MPDKGELIRLAVFGMPVKQSKSPYIHQQFALQFDLQIDYPAIESTALEFADKVQKLVDAGARGCNITAPLKHEAWGLAHRASPGSERARAANTLVFEKADDWYAENTDGRGLISDLVHHQGRDLPGSRILIIGAGGATAGILSDLLQQTPAHIVIGNRTAERAEGLAKRFFDLGPVSSSAMKQLDNHAPFDLVINATSLGHIGQVPPMPDTLFAANALCYDLNYGPVAAPLRQHCDARGIAYRDGLGMLVEQAAASFELWTGCKPDTGPILQKLRKDH